MESLKDKYNYNINSYTNLLLFKVDIKRNDTISRQVEYQMYNPDPKKIDEKIDLKECYNNLGKRRLDESDDKLNKNEVNISQPVNWSSNHTKYIDELYIKNDIFLLNSTDDFYNNVCFPYKTPNNGDLYLEERRKKYYINEPLCEDNCTLLDYEKDNGRIICKCLLRLNPQSIKNVNFTKKDINNVFNDTIKVPNLRIIKCASQAFKNAKNNFGLYITLILLLLFVLSYLYRVYFFKRKRYNKPFEVLRKQIKDQLEEIEKRRKNLKDEPEEDEGELEHLYKPNKEKEEAKDKQLIEDDGKPQLIEDDQKPQLIDEDEKSLKEIKTEKKKRDIKNKNINTNKENKKAKIIDSLSSGKELLSKPSNEDDDHNEDENPPKENYNFPKASKNPKKKTKIIKRNINKEKIDKKEEIDLDNIEECEEIELNDTNKNNTKISIIALGDNKKNKKKKENENNLNKINEENDEEQKEINEKEFKIYDEDMLNKEKEKAIEENLKNDLLNKKKDNKFNEKHFETIKEEEIKNALIKQEKVFNTKMN